MTDKTITTTTEEPEADTGAAPATSHSVSGPLALAGLLVVAVLTAGAAWHFYEQLNALQAAQDELAPAAELQSLRNDQDARLGELAGRLEALNSALESRLDAVARVENRLIDQGESARVLADRVDQLYRRMQSETDDWRYAEAAYLARIAVHRVRFNADVAGALEALESADILLAGLGGPAVDDREVLARAIDRLLGVQPPDIAGVSQRLSRVADALHTLPLTQSLAATEAVQEASVADSDAVSGTEVSARFARAWMRLRESLGALVSVSRDRRVEPLPDPEDRFLLEQNLMLQLEAARLSAISGEQEAYRMAIGRVHDWVKAYFDSASPEVQSLIQELAALQDVSVAFTPPDIGRDLAPILNGDNTP